MGTHGLPLTADGPISYQVHINCIARGMKPLDFVLDSYSPNRQHRSVVQAWRESFHIRKLVNDFDPSRGLRFCISDGCFTHMRKIKLQQLCKSVYPAH
jgi:hypothetical protein